MSKAQVLVLHFYPKKAWKISHYKHLEIMDEKDIVLSNPLLSLRLWAGERPGMRHRDQIRNNGAQEMARRLWALAVLQEA